jgi:uncharacterized membrane protein YdjX (TVP38/TMEM64 family)
MSMPPATNLDKAMPSLEPTGQSVRLSPSKAKAASNRRFVTRVFVGISWIALVVFWELWRRSQDLGYVDAAQRAINAAQHHWWAALAFVLIYLARPLILFPAAILTVCGGLLFGPVSGIALTIVGANGSAMVAYGIGRWLRAKPLAVAASNTALGGYTNTNTNTNTNTSTNEDTDEDTVSDEDVKTNASFAARWGTRLRAQEFETVLLLRLLGIPFDVVNVGCGLLHINPKRFLLATMIGSLPATVAFVLLGASLDRVDEGFGGIDKTTLVLSVSLIAGSIGVSQVVKRRSISRATR